MAPLSPNIDIFCPNSGNDQNSIFHPHNVFVSAVCNEHCSLAGALTRQETIALVVSPPRLLLLHFMVGFLLFTFICMCVCVLPCVSTVWQGAAGVDVFTFGTIRDLAFEPLIDFSHHFTSPYLSCLF